MTARVIKLICLDLIILYLISRMPFPLLVIPMVGCVVIYNMNEIKGVKDEKQANRKKKVKKKATKPANSK